MHATPSGLPAFDFQVLDLDGSLAQQGQLQEGQSASVVDLRESGPRIRMACGLRTYRAFEQTLDARIGARDGRPCLALIGSGDFHHVTLALLRRLCRPFNLLVLDKHPDWVRGIPFLHCGTWLARALRLPNLGRVFHVGGDLDFDNFYAPFAPWPELRSGRIRVIPARRHFRGHRWEAVPHNYLLSDSAEPFAERLMRLIEPDLANLADRPLYISIDKDVLTADFATVSWDSGFLELGDLLSVLEVFARSARGRFAGADIVGDWSPVRMAGWPRTFLDYWEHPSLNVRLVDATERNRQVNRALIARLQSLAHPLSGDP